MTEETSVVNEEKATTSRKAKSTRADRPKRIPVSGHRDILTVGGKDPAFHYRWVMDTDQNGVRIQKHLAAGYEFVDYNSVSGIGEARVANESGEGTLVRKPAGTTGPEGADYLYLMRIHKEWYEEDQKAKLTEVNAREEELKRELAGAEGRYGNVSIK